MQMLRVLVDDVPQGKGMLAGMVTASKTVDLDPDVLSQRIGCCIEAVSHALAGLQGHTPGFEVGNITFSLAVSAGGEISLLSIAKSTANLQSGIQITLKPVPPDVSRC